MPQATNIHEHITYGKHQEVCNQLYVSEFQTSNPVQT